MKRHQTNKNRLQLKDDAFSIERRKWYETMQEEFFQNYENFQHLQSLAVSDGKGVESVEEKKNDRFVGHHIVSGSSEIQSKSSWLVKMNEIPSHDCLGVVLCFHGVGMNPSAFMDFASSIAPAFYLQVFGVCLPGRMNRVNDPKVFNPRVMVYTIYEDLKSSGFLSFFSEKPIFLIGYCSGSLLCFDLARILLNEGYQNISGMVVMACRSPIKQSRYNIDVEGQVIYCNNKPANPTYYNPDQSEMTDRKLIQAMKDFGGIPTLFLERKELIKQFLPLYRYDFLILETYVVEAPYIPGEKRDLQLAISDFEKGFFCQHYSELMQLIRDGSALTAPSQTIEQIIKEQENERIEKERERQEEERRRSMIQPKRRSQQSSTPSSQLPSSPPPALTRTNTATSTASVPSQPNMSRQASKNPLQSQASTRSLSSIGTANTSKTPERKPPRKNEKLLKFQDDMNDVLTMPPSLFKVSIPIFSVSSLEDNFLPNEEDLRSWSSHSSIYHQHYSIHGGERENHYFFNSEESMKTIEIILNRLMNEKFTSEL